MLVPLLEGHQSSADSISNTMRSMIVAGAQTNDESSSQGPISVLELRVAVPGRRHLFANVCIQESIFSITIEASSSAFAVSQSPCSVTETSLPSVVELPNVDERDIEPSFPVRVASSLGAYSG